MRTPRIRSRLNRTAPRAIRKPWLSNSGQYRPARAAADGDVVYVRLPRSRPVAAAGLSPGFAQNERSVDSRKLRGSRIQPRSKPVRLVL